LTEKDHVLYPTNQTSDLKYDNTISDNKSCSCEVSSADRQATINSSEKIEHYDIELAKLAARLEETRMSMKLSKARRQVIEEMKRTCTMRAKASCSAETSFWDEQIKALNDSILELTARMKIKKGGKQLDETTKIFGNAVENFIEDSRCVLASCAVPPPSKLNKNLIKVKAPESLPEGYTFTAYLGEKSILATVPSGGVIKGEIFSVPLAIEKNIVEDDDSSTCASTSVDEQNDERHNYARNMRQKSTVPLFEEITQDSDTCSSRTPSPSQVIFETTSMPPILPMVKVRAPANLIEGHRFTAKHGEKKIVATVPQGGVKKGEIFVVPVSLVPVTISEF